MNPQTFRQTSLFKELLNYLEIAKSEIQYIFTFPYFQMLTFASVEDIGVEPMTPCVQGRCSDQLS